MPTVLDEGTGQDTESRKKASYSLAGKGSELMFGLYTRSNGTEYDDAQNRNENENVCVCARRRANVRQRHSWHCGKESRVGQGMKRKRASEGSLALTGGEGGGTQRKQGTRGGERGGGEWRERRQGKSEPQEANREGGKRASEGEDGIGETERKKPVRALTCGG